MITIEIFDYHLHSKHSFDGNDKIIDICKNAIKLTISEICFTEHFTVNPKDVSYKYLDYHVYSNDVIECIEKFGNSLKIKKGLEVGEPHIRKEILDNYMEDKNFDYIIGSIHNIGDMKLREHISNNTKEEFYQDYFEEVFKAAKYGDIDVLGHLDLMKRYAFDNYGNYSFNSYEEIIREILKVIIKRGIGVELNTSGLRNKVNEVFPSPDALKLYKRLGGEIITIGSDSHSIDFIGNNFDLAIKLLRNLGFKYIFKYTNRKPQGVKI